MRSVPARCGYAAQGKFWGRAVCSAPPLIICNYLFDSLTCDVYRVEQHSSDAAPAGAAGGGAVPVVPGGRKVLRIGRVSSFVPAASGGSNFGCSSSSGSSGSSSGIMGKQFRQQQEQEQQEQEQQQQEQQGQRGGAVPCHWSCLPQLRRTWR